VSWTSVRTPDPGVPMIYAGDEIGLAAMGPEHARIPMSWARPERWDQQRLATTRALFGPRQEGRPAARRQVRAQLQSLPISREPVRVNPSNSGSHWQHQWRAPDADLRLLSDRTRGRLLEPCCGDLEDWFANATVSISFQIRLVFFGRFGGFANAVTIICQPKCQGRQFGAEPSVRVLLTRILTALWPLTSGPSGA
jgi:hypothetical protein